ncbi:MAG: NUDIX hydrolase [Chloroflexi bacterium]|nr:NUDIX hydrolase [Chloroflexota bacterium]
MSGEHKAEVIGERVEQIDPSGFLDPSRPGHCARCGTMTVPELRGGIERPVCPACGWVYYAKNALGAAVAIVDDECILLIRRAHEPYQGQWMLPAGFVEYGEFAEDTAVREAAEETGLVVELAGLWGLYFGTDDPRNVAHLAVYGARPTGGTLVAGDDAEEAHFFPRSGLPGQIAFQAHRQAIADWLRRPLRQTAPTVGHPPA